MTNQNDILNRLDEAATNCEDITDTYKEVLLTEGEQDIPLHDGTTTPNLNKRLSSLVTAVSSVNGQTGAVVLDREDLGIPTDEALARQQKEDRFVITESGRTQREKNLDFAFVDDYGATGSVDRLSSKYQNLDDAKLDFPTAKTLNDTFDLVAFEKALSNHKVVYGSDKTYYFNRELRIPSYRSVIGQGIRKSIIKMTDDAYLYNNILTNEGNRKQGNKNSTNTPNEGIIIDGWTLDGNYVNVQNNTVSTATNNPLGIASSSGLGKSGLVFSGVQNSSIKNVEITQVSGHCLDIAARYNATEGSLVWSDLPSRNINIDNVILSYNQDDAFTTHFCEYVNLSNFLIYHSGVFNNSNGIEVDDGSRLVNISNGFIFNQTKGISIKSHDNAPAPFMVNVSNVTAVECNNSFDVECGAHNTVGDDSPSAYGVNFVNCVSWLARARANTTRNPRHIYVNTYSGVHFTNIHCYGDANTTLPRPTLDDFDYGRPYQPVGYGTGTGYNQVVMEDGLDVTYKKMDQSIIITGNARNIRFDNLNIDGVYAKTSHIYVHTSCNNVSLDKVTISNCALDASSAAGLIDVGGNASRVTINDVTAINNGSEITTYPIVKCLNYMGGMNDFTLTNVKSVGYKYKTRFSAELSEADSNITSKQNNIFGLKAGVATYVSNRSGSASGSHFDFIYSGGVKRMIIPAIAHAAVIGVNNAACRFGSSDTESYDDAYFWEVGTKTSGAALFPSLNNAFDLGKSANKVRKAFLNNLNIGALSVYADNTAAKAGGLTNGDVYRTSTGQLMVVF